MGIGGFGLSGGRGMFLFERDLVLEKDTDELMQI